MPQKSSGFSAIEFLIASVLGLTIIVGVCNVYLSVNKVYQRQANLAALQENIRFAAYILTRNIRMAGYIGCAKLDDLQQTQNYIEHAQAKLGFTLENSLHGYSSDNLPNYLAGRVTPNTDVIAIQKANSEQSRILYTKILPQTQSFDAYRNPATHNNPYLILSSCQYAEMFKAKEVGGTKISLAAERLAHEYNRKDALVSRFTEVAYFISTFKQPDGKMHFGLYMMTNQGNKEELLAGVKNMQITYGVAVGNKLTYRTFRAITVWKDVRSVHIILTLVNPDKHQKDLDLDLYVALRER